jgi:hypothetical protein
MNEMIEAILVGLLLFIAITIQEILNELKNKKSKQ